MSRLLLLLLLPPFLLASVQVAVQRGLAVAAPIPGNLVAAVAIAVAAAAVPAIPVRVGGVLPSA